LRAKNNAHNSDSVEVSSLTKLFNEVFLIEHKLESEDPACFDYTSIIVLLNYLTNPKLSFSETFGAKYLPPTRKWYNNPCNIKKIKDDKFNKTIKNIQLAMEIMDPIFESLLSSNLPKLRRIKKLKPDDKKQLIEEFYNLFETTLKKDLNFMKVIRESHVPESIFGNRPQRDDNDDDIIKQYMTVYIQKFIFGLEYHIPKNDRKYVTNLLTNLRLYNDTINQTGASSAGTSIISMSELFGNYWTSIERIVICIGDMAYYQNSNREPLDSVLVEWIKTIFESESSDDASDARNRRDNFSPDARRLFIGKMTALDSMHDYPSSTLWGILLDLLSELSDKTTPLTNDVNQIHIKMKMREICEILAHRVGMNMANFIPETINKRTAIIEVLNTRGANAHAFSFAESGNPLTNEKIREYHGRLIKSEQENFMEDLSESGKDYLNAIIAGTAHEPFVESKLIDAFDGCASTVQNRDGTTHTFEHVYGKLNVTIESSIQGELCSTNVGHLVTTKLQGVPICISGLVGPYTVNGSVATLQQMRIRNADNCTRGTAVAVSNAYPGRIEGFCSIYGFSKPDMSNMTQAQKMARDPEMCIYYKTGLHDNYKILDAFAKKAIGDKVCEIHTVGHVSPITCLFTIDGCIKYSLLMSFLLGDTTVLPTVYETVGANFRRMVGTSGENKRTKSERMLQNIIDCISIIPSSGGEYREAVALYKSSLGSGGTTVFTKNCDMLSMFKNLHFLNENKSTKCEDESVFEECSKFIIDRTIPPLIDKINKTSNDCITLLKRISPTTTPENNLVIFKQLSNLPSIERMIKSSSITDYSLNACELSILKDLGRKRKTTIMQIVVKSLSESTIVLYLTRDGEDFLPLLQDEGHSSVDHLKAEVVNNYSESDERGMKTWRITYEYTIGFLIECLTIVSDIEVNLNNAILVKILTYFMDKYDELSIEDENLEFAELLNRIPSFERFRNLCGHSGTRINLSDIRKCIIIHNKQNKSGEECSVPCGAGAVATSSSTSSSMQVDLLSGEESEGGSNKRTRNKRRPNKKKITRKRIQHRKKTRKKMTYKRRMNNKKMHKRKTHKQLTRKK